MIDTSGKAIKSARLERSLFYSLIAGGMGSVWFILCQPQQILTVFIRNYLHASDAQLGNFVAILNFAGIFHLAAILLFSKVKRIKPTWVALTTLQRSSAFIIAGAAFYVHRGGSTQVALWFVMGVSFLFSFVLGNICGSAWWTWISVLLPEKYRASYFGKRSALAQLLNIIAFFSASWLLDTFEVNVYLVYTFIYLVAGVLGVADSLLHLAVPEPMEAQEKEAFSKTRFLEPMKNRNFLRFTLITGFSVMSINIATPFQAPYITNPDIIGAPNLWLGIMYLISQSVWMLMVPFWGMLMDRMGKKPVVLLGLLFPLAFPLYLLLTPTNYPYLLPLISLWLGLFSPAFWEGLSQMMLSLSPSKNRTAYIAWYWAMMGMVGSLGPFIGGQIMTYTESFFITNLFSMLMLFIAMFILSRVTTHADKSFEHVVSVITAPSAYRTYSQLSTLSGTMRPDKVEKALKGVKTKTGLLAFEEVASRLDDPDQTVREEAAFAMGRIATDEARDILVQHLMDHSSLVRPEAAKALGLMRDNQAIPHLIDALYTGNEELQEEAAIALGKLNSKESVNALKQLIKEDRSERVKVSSAQSIASQGDFDAVVEIMDLWEQSTNRVLKTQLSISIANLLGRPGEFYRCVTGTTLKRESAISNLYKDLYTGLRKLKSLDSGYLKHIIGDSLPSVEEAFGEEDYNSAFSDIYRIILNLIYRKLELMGFDQEKIDAESFLRANDSFLYLGNHLMHRLESSRVDNGKDMSATEILLGLYFLQIYCEREAKKNKGPKLK